MSASISPLSLTVVRSSSLPRTSSDPAYASLIDSLFTNAQALTTSLATWKTGKTFTPTYTKPDRSNAPLEIRSFSAARPPGTGQDDTKWFARVSTHKDANYEGFVQGLLKNHSPNEAAYIEDCTEAKLLATIADGELAQYRMSYHLPFPTTNREFVILIATKDVTTAGGPRKFQVVTVPTEHPDAPEGRKGFVRGRYSSVEEVEELEGGGAKWRMATVSNPGGLVPQWITELAMPSKISEDVPSFLAWIEKRHAHGA